MEPEGVLAEVVRAFRGVRRVVLDAFAGPRTVVRHKADGSVVTDLDGRLEERLAGALLALDPAWGVFSEEAGLLRDGDPVWHLDPLDGTRNFARHDKDFVCQAALVAREGPLLCVVYEPLPDDLSWAVLGGGAFREGRRLVLADGTGSVRTIFSGRRATTLESRVAGLPRGLHRLRSRSCAGLHARAVASGKADALVAWRRRPSPVHDVAPGLLLVREAGGIVTTIEGGDPLEERESLIAAAPATHAELLAALGRSPG